MYIFSYMHHFIYTTFNLLNLNRKFKNLILDVDLWLHIV